MHTDSSANLRQRHAESSSNQETVKEFTTDQVEIVQKIKKCKDYYEVLGVTKESSDADIRKAYKKLALQLHPDKNRAPGAVEAFKTIGNAVATLTDARKRKEYDLFGKQGTSRLNHTSHSHGHNYDFAYDHAAFEADVAAEELFNMFFGGTPPRRARFTRYQQEPNQQPSLAFGLILILVVISTLSSFFTSDPVYSLSQTTKYPVQRQTSHLNINYYVKENFVNEYEGSLARLESSVEEDYIIIMKQNCFRERSYQDSMIARARSFGTRQDVVRAQELKTPSCDNLSRIGLNRFTFY